jgi:hypothetical protein
LSFCEHQLQEETKAREHYE